MGNKITKNNGPRSGSVVIITGASSGLGKQLSLLYCKRQLRMILTGRDQKRLNQTKQLCQRQGNSEIITFIGDLTQQQKCKQLVSVAVKRFNRIDCLILNAGINAHFQFKDLQSTNIFNKLMQTNLYSNVNLTKLALPYLKKCNGKIIVISSLSGKFGLPSRSAYCASKFALTGFFQSLRTEQNMDIIMVYPTSLQTPMRNNSLSVQMKSDHKAKSVQNKNEKRQNPKIAAEFIINSIEKGSKDIYIPFKGYIGIILQPLFPNYIRQKLKKAAKL